LCNIRDQSKSIFFFGFLLRSCSSVRSLPCDFSAATFLSFFLSFSFSFLFFFFAFELHKYVIRCALIFTDLSEYDTREYNTAFRNRGGGGLEKRPDNRAAASEKSI